MKSTNTNSGIDIIGNIPWGMHFCQFYQAKEDLMDILVPYFKAGLENNEFCLWVMPEQLDEDEAKEALKVAIPDIDTYLVNGQIEIVPYTYWHINDASNSQKVLNYLIEKTGKALASRYNGLRYSGNNFCGHNRILDSVIGKHPMIALCTYSLDSYSSIDTIKIASNHQFSLVKKEGKWELIENSEKKNSNNCEESEDRYKAVFDNSLDGIFITIPDGTILAANPAACQMFGMTKEELIQAGRNGTVDTSDPRLKYVLEERAKTGRFKGELNHRRKDGTIFPGEISSAFFKDKSGLTEGVMIIRDITKRKQTEEELSHKSEMLQRIFDNIPVLLVIWDPHLGRFTLNHYAEQVLGWTTDDANNGDFMAKVYPNATYRIEVSAYMLGLKTGWREWICTTKDGHHVPIDWANIFLTNDTRIGIGMDLRERKRAEAKLKETLDNLEHSVKERTSELEKAYNSLKESEERLAEAQKMAHIGNWVWDIATGKEYWSDELHRIFKHDPQEAALSYKKYINYVHPDDRDYVDNAFKGTINGKPYEIEHRIILANGEERTVHIQAEVVFNDKNIPIQTKGIVQDITERKRTEERVQSLANVVESSQDAIVTVSLDGIVSSWNKGAEQVYCHSAAEVLRKDVSILAPDNLKDEAKKLIDRVKHGIKIKNYETSRLKKDGTLITVSITLSPVFDTHGKLTAISFISRDITERKRVEEKLRESEERYRNIVETSNEGIYLVDDEARITYANKIMETSGYTLKELIGRPIWDFISKESKPVAKRSFEKRRQGINDSYELKLMRKDGSFIWGLISAKSLFNKEGKFIGYLGMLTDITERKEAEEALNIIETARKKEIHHRIKNNLQVISSLLDLQAEQFRNRQNIRDSEVLEAFRESQDRVTSMALIHEELYKGGGFETLNFSPYIRELAGTLFQTYRLGNICICLNIDLEENLFFDMDTAVPLGMIVNELISNSLKHAFIGRDRGEIKIKLHREEPTELENEGCQSTSFIMTISDNGVGTPQNLDIENLDSLGMQLVTSLVDQLDGELELKRNNGTEFTIRFTVKGKNE